MRGRRGGEGEGLLVQVVKGQSSAGPLPHL